MRLFVLTFICAVVLCYVSGVPGRCKQPLVTGPCRAYIPSYGYDPCKKQCVEFIYGGCRGNENRFDYKAECEAACRSSGSKCNK
ncbi:trypsin inhibitor-like [Anticarsia gemmatalis]|uniref:trypsin inhibitor-like n=1 Tax=Anticarsia gemmatalis TaxID=129554 RepID=UPI003F75A349